VARAKAYVILEGTPLPIDRIAADRPYYAGKHKRHGMNVQVLADPLGRLIWASPALPGAARDLTAARTHAVLKGWRLLRKLRCSPRRTTPLVQAVISVHLATPG